MGCPKEITPPDEEWPDDGRNVYVAGWDVSSIEGEPIVRARLWKNGETQHLEDDSSSSIALSVFVSGNDVHVLGSELLPNQRVILKVWKNGEAEILGEDVYPYLIILGTIFNSTWNVNSLFVSNGDVYVAGHKTTRTGTQATIWKNGVADELVSESSNSNVASVFVSGNVVYAVGYDNGPKLWKNGQVEKLTGTNARAFSVFVSDKGVVYVSGHDGAEARLWKNGIVQDIADDDARLFRSVFIKDDDVYLAGYVEATQEVEPGSGVIPVNYFKATLWKNGKRLNLNVSKYEESRGFSVFVK